MTPSARLQAAIEMLDWIIAAARDNGASADNIAKKFFKERRYAGSGDRRAIRELVYSAIRRWGDRPESGRQAMLGLIDEQPELRELFTGTAYGPAAIEAGEAVAGGAQIPEWLADRFAGLIDETERRALFDRAPLHVRVNGQRSTDLEVKSAWPDAVALALPHAYELPTGTQLEDKTLFREGAKLSGGEINDMTARAMRVIYDDEKDHYVEMSKEAVRLIENDGDLARMTDAIRAISAQRVRMRGEMFRAPMTRDEIAAFIETTKR